MPTILDEIVQQTRKTLAERKTIRPLPELLKTLEPAPPALFEKALRTDRPLHFILEIKLASPSAGVLTEQLDLDALLTCYNRFASALSVLTDEVYFKGSFDLLHTVTQKSPHPVLCKDFILDPYQVAQARHAGAHAVLLIVKILTDVQLANLVHEIRSWGMTPVVEIQNELELERAMAVDPTVLLINNRNLASFEISFQTTLDLAPLIPPPLLTISASGIEHPQDLAPLKSVCSHFLIGSVLMKTPLSELPAKLEALASA